jgi:hypothetical protein
MEELEVKVEQQETKTEAPASQEKPVRQARERGKKTIQKRKKTRSQRI